MASCACSAVHSRNGAAKQIPIPASLACLLIGVAAAARYLVFLLVCACYLPHHGGFFDASMFPKYWTQCNRVAHRALGSEKPSPAPKFGKATKKLAVLGAFPSNTLGDVV